MLPLSPPPPVFGVAACAAAVRLVLPPPGESSGVAAGDEVLGVATALDALWAPECFSGIMERRVRERE